MTKISVTFKLEEEIHVRLRGVAKDEGRGMSEIVRQAVTDWLQKEKTPSVPECISCIKEQQSLGKKWAEISRFLLERYGVSLSKAQVKSLSKTDQPPPIVPLTKGDSRGVQIT